MFVNYNVKRGCKGKEYYEEVIAGIIEFKNSDPIFASIPDDESRNYGCSVEASYLCHGIWNVIMENEFQISASNEFTWKNKDSELLFHFDVMNNPNMANNVYSCGIFKKCSPDLRKKVKDIYHSIGNMAPVPWFKIKGDNYIDIQGLHRSLDERWDLLLLVLKANWNLWNKGCKLTFEQYMILTCQQPCYEEIYNKAVKKGIDKISSEDITLWNTDIKPNSKIITFNSDETEDASAEKILNIIKIRCKIIRVLLCESNLEDWNSIE